MARKKSRLANRLQNAQPNRIQAPGSEIYLKKHIKPVTEGQRVFWELLKRNDMTFCIGPPGSGKTLIACYAALLNLVQEKVEKIILCVPAVEAGEKLGFMPGNIDDKMAGFVAPLISAIKELLPSFIVDKLLKNKKIEIRPLAFMLGSTFKNSFVIFDEAENSNRKQMKMLLTRIGDNSRMVILGDLEQNHLKEGTISGLQEAEMKLRNTEGIGFCELTANDIVRHPLIGRILKALR